ncbi:MAG: hypothetical protein ABW035_08260 [Acidimicrobiales bacterium]
MEQHGRLIVGGGNAGISLAARLLRDGEPDRAPPGGLDVGELGQGTKRLRLRRR